MFLVLFCSVLVDMSDFPKIQLVCDGWTNGRTDIPSYRDARTHLKTMFCHGSRKRVQLSQLVEAPTDRLRCRVEENPLTILLDLASNENGLRREELGQHHLLALCPRRL